MLADTEDTSLSHNEQLFCAVSPGLYSFFMNDAFPTNYFPFPAEVDSVLDFSACNSDNECETLKANNAQN